MTETSSGRLAALPDSFPCKAVSQLLPMYVELHTRSAFSFLEGGSLPEELISVCGSQSMPAVALLDRDGVYGAPRFHMAAKRVGLRAHIGAEVSVQDVGLQSVAPAWINTPAAPQPVRYSLLVETPKATGTCAGLSRNTN